MTASTSLAGRFFRALPADAPWLDVVLWWESRRIPYTLLLTLAIGGLYGVGVVLSLVVPPLSEVFEGGPGGMLDLLYQAGLFLILPANLWYTGGWIGHLVVRALWRPDGSRFAPRALLLGLVFSVVFVVLVWVATSLTLFVLLAIPVVGAVLLVASPVFVSVIYTGRWRRERAGAAGAAGGG